MAMPALRRTSRATRVAISTAAATLVAVVAFTQVSSGASSSDRVAGEVVDHQVPCLAVFCNAGTYTTGGIQGDFEFTTTVLIPTPVPGVSLYLGYGTIHTVDGDIDCQDSGVTTDGSDGAGVHLCRIVGGTGLYKNANGYLQERFFYRKGRILFPNGGSGGGDYQGEIRLANGTSRTLQRSVSGRLRHAATRVSKAGVRRR
jgi:hypothetical protein